MHYQIPTGSIWIVITPENESIFNCFIGNTAFVVTPIYTIIPCAFEYGTLTLGGSETQKEPQDAATLGHRKIPNYKSVFRLNLGGLWFCFLILPHE